MNTRKNLLIVVGEWWEARRTESNVVTPGGKPGRLSRLAHWLMPNGGTLLLIALLIATQSVWARNLQAPAAPGPSATTVNYQGRLADSGGTPINGSRAMSFAIFDAATGGNLIWGPETHAAISVSSGLFSVGLGSQTSGGIPTTAWNGDRYLEITVGGETLSPRELIRSVPIAGMALTVPDGAVTPSKLSFPTFKLLGQKTCASCGMVNETGSVSEWVPVKGDSNQDIIEVTAATRGAPLLVQMTSRSQSSPAVGRWCAVAVYQGATRVRFAHLDGNWVASIDYGCSGSYLFTDLPAGTYTFRALSWFGQSTTATWLEQRQIAVFEY
jgi:hypothetical protein